MKPVSVDNLMLMYHVSCTNFYHKHHYILSASSEEEAIEKVSLEYSSSGKYKYQYYCQGIVGQTTSNIFYQVT